MGLGGDHMVSVVTFYSNDPSLNAAIYYVKTAWIDRTKKRLEMAHLNNNFLT